MLSSPPSSPESDRAMSLSYLPYDLLLNIAIYLDLYDIHALHLVSELPLLRRLRLLPLPPPHTPSTPSPADALRAVQTCKSLHDFASTRHVYRKLAHDLLGRCRALPLKGFQRLSDLSTDQLVRAVNKASRLEIAWRRRAPRPIQSRDALSELLDDHCHGPESSGSLYGTKARRKWYKVVSAPPNEEVDWLSPITSKYTLCATKSGKVVCWDVKSDTCIAEWSPPERWELWKCRVEFEQRTVFFTMAKVIQGSYDDDRVMEFVLMKLEFFDDSFAIPTRPPAFSHISAFKTAGVVMNVFLLDPIQRLLSAFVWLASSNTIGLYVLLDWEKAEYVFIDTGIEGVMSSNWSCILFEKNIVIHCEESTAAFQHFYPIPLLRKYKCKMGGKTSTPQLFGRLLPARTLSKKFVFPKLNAPPVIINHMPFDGDPNAFGGLANAILTPGGLLLPLPPDVAANLNAELADGGAVDLAQVLTPQQLEQLFAQAPLIAVLPPGQNFQLMAQPGLEQILPFPVQMADNLGHQVGSATQPVTGGVAGQMDAGDHEADGDLANHVPEDPEEEDDDDDENEPNQTIDDGDGFSNPFPFPWYPESAHFVRQWWPTLPGVPRVSCTVVLLAAHDPQTHATRFVLAQHYFRVPLDWKGWKESQQMAACPGNHKAKRKKRKRRGQSRCNGKTSDGEDTPINESPIDQASNDAMNDDLSEGSSSSPPLWGNGHQTSSDTCDTDFDTSSEGEDECECGWAGEQYENMGEEDDSDNSMRMWYVSTPFDVVCVTDMDEEEDGQAVERPRPLIAVDFGHAVWIEHSGQRTEGGDDRDSIVSEEEEEQEQNGEESWPENASASVDSGMSSSSAQGAGEGATQKDPKRLRFVTFPPYDVSSTGPKPEEGKMEGEVRTLRVPDDLDLDGVETINIDQSQGAVILSVKEGKIFILCYE